MTNTAGGDSRADFTIVAKRRVSAEVVQQIQARIRDGALRPGEQLPSERELAARLGVSRMSVREGLRLLEVMGYLRTDAGRGTFVAPQPEPVGGRVTRERLDLLEDETLFEQLAVVREAIEPRLAALAARLATPEDLARLWERHAEVGRHAEARDLAAFTRADLALHNAIADVARNRVFRHIIDDLQELLLEMRQISIADLAPNRLGDTQCEHQCILEAIAAGDEAAATQAMLDHFAAQRRAYQVARQRRPAARGSPPGSPAGG